MHAHEIARRMHKLDTKVTLAWLSYDFQLSPVMCTAVDNSDLGAGDIHNTIAELEELLMRQRLREEIRKVVRRSDEGDNYLVVLHAFAYEEVATLDMLHAIVVLGVVNATAIADLLSQESRVGSSTFIPSSPNRSPCARTRTVCLVSLSVCRPIVRIVSF